MNSRILSVGAHLLLGCLLFACTSQKDAPDVSEVEVPLELIRYEKDFFAMDTTQLDTALNKLYQKEEAFTVDFLTKIMGLQDVDSSLWSQSVKQFITTYRSVFEITKNKDKEIDDAVGEIQMALRYVKHYFPKYELPKKVITFIGPLDAFAYGQTGGGGEIITPEAIGIGLQLHLGADASFYNSDEGLQMYPTYLSRRFTVQNIPVNAIKNIVDDIYPPLNPGANLLEMLIDHGKRMHLLDLFLPDFSDSLKLGYTANQLKGMEENEGFIWNYYKENNLLYENDYLKIRSFITDGPSTAEFGLGSPGFTSLFMGRQIVRAYLDKVPDATIDQLLATDAQTILKTSGYRPK